MTSPEQLYDRRLKLRVDSIELDEYDIEFRVEKELRSEPNNAQIKVYNIDPNQRSLLQKSAVQVEISAGYPRTTTRIFKGSVRFVNTQHLGPDIVTVIEAGEGESAYRTARLKKTFSAGTTLKRVVSELAATFDGIGKGNLETVGLEAFKVVKSLTIDGPSAHYLEQQLKSFGFGWTIEQDAFVFVRLGRAVDQQVVVLDDTSGLIGSPEMGEKKAEKSDKEKPPDNTVPRRYMKVRTLLNGRIKPGTTVRLDTEERKGDFVAEKITHSGSNFDNDFYSDVEAFATT